LGITDEQKAKIERAFENHRQKLASDTELVNKEEAALNRLLQTEPIERNAILSQTDRVIFARGELERENSAMTLEMRESLTLAQWLQVPQPNAQLRTVRYATAPGVRGATPTPAPAGAGERGGRGQRSGGQRQQ
jgi:Spy/CpxP family protein refolding chaperone